jgi:BirA family transcriptional regulator, biotin operon repressor / biotin---[acetyl-CoA-carboxylase] ligase
VNPITWRVEHFEEINSTNTYVSVKAKEGASEGLVARADYQSAGRGRLDRTWEAPPRSALMCSILLSPPTSPDEMQLVVAAVALSARSALGALCSFYPQLKWPNDLIVDDKKIAGLLAEVVQSENGITIVAGIGINLTDSPEGLPATNALKVSGVTITPEALLEKLLEELNIRRGLLDTEAGRQMLRAEYESVLETIGRSVIVEQSDAMFPALATGIDATGRLILNAAGEEKIISVGDVIHVRHVQVIAP